MPNFISYRDTHPASIPGLVVREFDIKNGMTLRYYHSEDIKVVFQTPWDSGPVEGDVQVPVTIRSMLREDYMPERGMVIVVDSDPRNFDVFKQVIYEYNSNALKPFREGFPKIGGLIMRKIDPEHLLTFIKQVRTSKAILAFYLYQSGKGEQFVCTVGWNFEKKHAVSRVKINGKVFNLDGETSLIESFRILWNKVSEIVGKGLRQRRTQKSR